MKWIETAELATAFAALMTSGALLASLPLAWGVTAIVCLGMFAAVLIADRDDRMEIRLSIEWGTGFEQREARYNALTGHNWGD